MNLPSFAGDLMAWYARSKRDFPWRQTADPYKIWISEIMLQQTRTEVVRGYFTRFVRAFPSVKRLAEADRQDVLRFWQGLGYYSRARNLHAAAKIIVSEHKGRLPQTCGELRRLPGVGEYTAGAILSIAFRQPVPAIDGNVVRVITRMAKIQGDAKTRSVRAQISALLEKELKTANPSDFNQALMDLSAMICLPKSPRCGQCPLLGKCRAQAAGLETKIPRKTRSGKLRLVKRFAACVRNQRGLLLVQRSPKGLLAGFWDLPAIETKVKRNLEQLFFRKYGFQFRIQNEIGRSRHVFSHQEWDTRIFECELLFSITYSLRPARFFTHAEIQEIPFPNAIRAILGLTAKPKA